MPAVLLQLPDRKQCPQSNSGCYQIIWDYQTWWHWSDPHHGVPELDGIFQWQPQKWGAWGEVSPFLTTLPPCQWRRTTPAACCPDITEKNIVLNVTLWIVNKFNEINGKREPSNHGPLSEQLTRVNKQSSFLVWSQKRNRITLNTEWQSIRTIKLHSIWGTINFNLQYATIL